jgi:hypothetical protein
MYRRQMIAIEDKVVMIPAGVLHQPTVIMMEDGHRITRKSVLPTTMILQTPNLQRRPRTVPDTLNAAVPARIAVALALIGFDDMVRRLSGEVTRVLGLRALLTLSGDSAH